MKMLKCAGAILLVSATSLTQAGVIYDGGSPDHSGGFVADTNSPFEGTQAAEPFNLSAGDSTIGGVHWWGFCGSLPGTCPAGDFTLFFYSNNAGSPGALIGSYGVGNADQTATGSPVLFSSEYSYSASIPDLTLAAGTEYWLGISNTTTTGYKWSWETTSPLGSHAQYVPDSGGWITGLPASLAFNLTGPSAVPEPGPLALFSAGLFGLVVFMQRRRKAAGSERREACARMSAPSS